MANPKSDAEKLLIAALGLAETMLIKYGEFYPYGAVMEESGETRDVLLYEGEEHPPSNELIHTLRDFFQRSAKEHRFVATAVVYDVLIALPGESGKSDAIAVDLDHREGYSVIVFYPYKVLDGTVVLGDAVAQDGEYRVFGRQSN